MDSLSLSWENLDPMCVPSDSPPVKHDEQDTQSSVSEVDRHSSGLALHALVQGSGGVVLLDTVVPPQSS